MNNIYLPVEITSPMCAYVFDKDTIRVYESQPTANSTINYTDYYIHSNYLEKTGTTTFNQYSNLNYNCIAYDKFTTNTLYHNDFYIALFIAFIFIFSCFFLISKLWRRLNYGRKIF